MLQAMRRNSRHAIIYVLFGILIAAFIISFGPGSRGFGYSGVTSAYAAKIAGATVSEQEYERTRDEGARIIFDVSTAKPVESHALARALDGAVGVRQLKLERL